jgi:tRNA(Arg) A34 adenosine deaminase TadA
LESKLPLGLRMARLASKKSTYKVRIGACLIERGRITIAWNKRITDPRVKQNGFPFVDSNHAKWNLFPHSYQLTKPIRGIVYVFRAGFQGQLRLARPCVSCRNFLRLRGIRKIVYTTHNSWTEEKL